MSACAAVATRAACAAVATLALLTFPAAAQYYEYGYGGGQRPWQSGGRGWQPGSGYAYPPGLNDDRAANLPASRRPVYAPAPYDGSDGSARSAAFGTGRTIDRLSRQIVLYPSGEAPGTIVINTSEHYLYLVLGEGKALRYAVGVGREGFAWSGTQYITRKKEWPDWRPPQEMLERRPDLPAYMPGGPENPLGARALYLGDTLYRIHGSNEPETIGRSVSSGCIRMLNDDVEDLYERVDIGTKVKVL
ncbi:L,D-transpeptidase [Ancylobacter crimeensis]